MTASAGPVLKRLHAEYGDRIAFVTLYVREAHPGEWYPQAKTFEQKLEYARTYQERDQIPWPVAVDSVDGELHRFLDPKPNAAYLMDIYGNVAFRSLWSNDEGALRDGLEAIVSRPERPIGQAQTRMVPMLKGVGTMYDLLEFSGGYAKTDVLRQAPPVYVMARLAALFKPLPPLGRALAAMGVIALGTAAVIGGINALSRSGRDRS